MKTITFLVSIDPRLAEVLWRTDYGHGAEAMAAHL